MNKGESERKTVTRRFVLTSAHVATRTLSYRTQLGKGDHSLKTLSRKRPVHWSTAYQRRLLIGSVNRAQNIMQSAESQVRCSGIDRSVTQDIDQCMEKVV